MLHALAPALPDIPARLSREQRLLAALCRGGDDIDPGMLAAAAYGDGIDLAALDLDVRRQKVIPRVHVRIGALPARGPDCPSRRFAREYAGNVNWSLRLVKELLAATRMLRDAGIPCVPMKGVSLAQQWYGSLAARTAGDVDLLVPPEHGAKAEALFREAGYRPWENPDDPEDRLPERLRYEEAFRNPRTGVLVELHFRLNHNPNLMPLPFREIWAQAEPLAIGGETIHVMGDAHQFAYLCVHGARHEWSRLQWVCDLDRMLRARPADARAWLATADRLGVAGPVAQGMVFADALLGSPIPDEARARAQGVASVRYLLAHGAQHLFRRQRKPERRPGDPRTSATLYMMCLNPRPAYLAFEAGSRLRELGKDLLPRRVARALGAG